MKILILTNVLGLGDFLEQELNKVVVSILITIVNVFSEGYLIISAARSLEEDKLMYTLLAMKAK